MSRKPPSRRPDRGASSRYQTAHNQYSRLFGARPLLRGWEPGKAARQAINREIEPVQAERHPKGAFSSRPGQNLADRGIFSHKEVQ